MGVDNAYIYKIFPFRKTSATRNDNLQVSLILQKLAPETDITKKRKWREEFKGKISGCWIQGEEKIF